MKYASVIVDNNTNATDGLFTYAFDSEDIKTGSKVKVPFAKANRTLDGYVVEISDTPPEGVKRFKNIVSVDSEFSLTEESIKTAVWMHNRYACRYIEAVRCFLPSASAAKRKTKDPFEGIEEQKSKAEILNPGQQKAFDEIKASIRGEKHEIFLLFGVTGSGKTEIYLQSMQECLDKGRRGIILVPEISLTPQLISRFVNRFGRDSIAVLHSGLTEKQKAVQYERIRSGQVQFVVGVRSAIFAPFDNIGLIVMDEEHESSYKSDMSPKYDCMEVAVKRAMQHNAAVVLGSATPSVSDYYRAGKGIFRKLVLNNRYNNNPLPLVETVDMRKEIKAGNRSLFSSKLIERMNECFDNKEQVILFLNRRGYSGYVSCRECGYVMRCPECGISMTYHRSAGAMVCHYCGRKLPYPKICPECGSDIIGRFGAGTEQLEEKTLELFPGKRIERLDFDTAQKKGNTEKILKDFEKGKIDILIGTQLVAKGLDVANVGLVGIISADLSLNIPDYRSSERCFQLVTQAAGRSGRGDKQGRVVVQSYNPEHQAIQTAARQDYEAFYKDEIKIRKIAEYPPFTDLFRVLLSNKDEEIVIKESEKLAAMLEKEIDESYTLLGPCKSPLNKEGGKFRRQIIIKSPAGKRQGLSRTINTFKKEWKGESVFTVDINPYSMI